MVLNARANLEVTDVVRSVAFYRGALGLEPTITMGEPAVFAVLGSGAAAFGLCRDANPAVAKIVAVYLDVDDVEDAYARCRAAGVEIVAPPTTHPWLMRDFVIRDPDGHQVAVGQRVAG